MPETGGTNIEIAHHLSEGRQRVNSELSRGHEMMEILEAILLALVACLTAWSGYQAALWDAQQSLLYGQSSKIRVQAEALSVRNNQESQYDAANVNEWLKAEASGQTALAEFFERRFLPQYRPVFEAWKKTDPLHNPNAVAGPALMEGYHDSGADKLSKMDHEATELFERGTTAREYGDQYVRMSVTLATVLLLVAISQRFRTARIRLALILLAAVLLCLPLWHILVLPRA